ncbi:unnamed protein product [Arctogadus glacialis]
MWQASRPGSTSSLRVQWQRAESRGGHRDAMEVFERGRGSPPTPRRATQRSLGLQRRHDRVFVNYTNRFHNSFIHLSVTMRVAPGQTFSVISRRPLDTPVVECSPPRTALPAGAVVTVEGVRLRYQHLEARSRAV